MKKNIFIAYPVQNQGRQESTDNAQLQPTDNKAETKGPTNKVPHGVEQKTTRITIDLPKNLHKALKRVMAEEEKTIRTYIINLIEADLKGR